MFDCHVHSNFSGDSEMDAEIACNKAMDLGLEGIAFTDHLDYDYPDYNEKFDIDFKKYSEFMDKLKNKFNCRLKVLKGIEVGIQPHVIEKTDAVVKSFDFDFVISSIHIVDKVDPYFPKYYEGKTKEQAFGRYLEEILYSIKNFNNYDVIGHIGYVRRYCPYDDRSLRYVDFSDTLDEILRIVISNGKGIEANSSGCRTGLDTPIPDYDIIKRYKELGGEIICIGSDAHFPEYIASDFKTVKDKLAAIGFEYLTHFEGRKPMYKKI